MSGSKMRLKNIKTAIALPKVFRGGAMILNL
jgi:hypothetical protein